MLRFKVLVSIGPLTMAVVLAGVWPLVKSKTLTAHDAVQSVPHPAASL
jgi:hypothetical protein